MESCNRAGMIRKVHTWFEARTIQMDGRTRQNSFVLGVLSKRDMRMPASGAVICLLQSLVQAQGRSKSFQNGLTAQI